MDFTDARISEMLAGRRAVRVYSLPFAEGIDIGIRVLSEKEIDDSRIEAQRYCKARGVDVDIDPDFLERETRRQMLWRALVNPADHSRPFFPADSQLRELDTELVRVMFEAYWEHQRWVSPLTVADEELAQKVAEALGKGPAPQLLTSFDPDTLRRLCISLALVLRRK